MLYNKNGNSLAYVAIKAHQPEILKLLVRGADTRYSLGDCPARISRRAWPLIEDPDLHGSLLDFAAKEGRLDLFLPIYNKWTTVPFIREERWNGSLIRAATPIVDKFTPRLRYYICRFVNLTLLRSLQIKLGVNDSLIEFAWLGGGDYIQFRGAPALNARVPPTLSLGWHNAMRVSHNVMNVLDTLRFLQEHTAERRGEAHPISNSYQNSVDLYGNTPLHIAAEEGRLDAVRWLYEYDRPAQDVLDFLFLHPHINPDCDLYNRAVIPRTPLDLCLNSPAPDSCQILPILMEHSPSFVPINGLLTPPTITQIGAKFDSMMLAAKNHLNALAVSFSTGQITDVVYRADKNNLYEIYMTKWRIYTSQVPQAWFKSAQHNTRLRALKASQYGHPVFRMTWMTPAFETPYVILTRRSRNLNEDLLPGFLITVFQHTSGSNAKPHLVKVASLRRAATRTPEIVKLSVQLISHLPSTSNPPQDSFLIASPTRHFHSLYHSFDNIYLDLSKQPGKCKLADSGLGWRPSGGGDTFTLDSSNIGAAHWSRAAKGFELKILSRNSGVIQLDGFDQEVCPVERPAIIDLFTDQSKDFERMSKAFKIWYGINVETREHALRGWNWGKTEFTKAELAFNVQNRPAFEVPYSEIANTNLAGRNEVAVEFALPTGDAGEGAVKPGSTKNRGRKAAAGPDELVEMRFYIPGTAVKNEKAEGAEGAEGEEEENDDDAEEQNAANLFYETLMDKAEIGDVAGDTFATFLDVLHLTPRGRFDIDMYESSFRLRGKTYDYKIQYSAIKKFFLLPKNDDTHTLIVLGLDPPLRQGQTRYPFLVMQLKLDEEISLEMNMTEDIMQSQYKDKLQPHYEEPIHQVVTKVFRGLSGKKVIMPSKDFVSHHGHHGVKCSIKANEGLLYFLDKSLMFVPKPATYIQMDNIAMVTMSRVGGAVSASRTFDITVGLKNGLGEHQFSNINREEQKSLEDFFKAKSIRIKNEMAEEASGLIAAALDNDAMGSSDEEARPDRGSADEDESSVDEDFDASSESDVAEEFDSDHESSGGSDEEMQDAPAGDDDERPKKKTKTSQ
ncbi:unnamed protein product [Penicillium salamii]|nr:unnamed protein product [Penicillium salamii]